MSTRRWPSAVATLLLCLLAVHGPSALAAVSQSYTEVSATSTNTTVTFTFPARLVTVINRPTSANEVYVNLAGTVATASHIPLEPGQCFTAGGDIAAIGLITAVAETATVRVIALAPGTQGGMEGCAVGASGAVVDVSDRAARDLGKVDVALLDQYTPIDTDSGGGTANALPVNLRITKAGGGEFGTATDPVRTDPTGTTTQPVSLTAGNFPDNEPFNQAQVGGVAVCKTTTVNAQGVANAGVVVDATAGGVTVLAASTTRCGALLYNLQGGGDALCAPTAITVTTTVGFYLAAGQSLAMQHEAQGAWKCIRQAGTNATLYVAESTP